MITFAYGKYSHGLGQKLAVVQYRKIKGMFDILGNKLYACLKLMRRLIPYSYNKVYSLSFLG